MISLKIFPLNFIYACPFLSPMLLSKVHLNSSKHIKTILIYQKNDPTFVTNYKPITLTCSIYKLYTNTFTNLLTAFGDPFVFFSSIPTQPTTYVEFTYCNDCFSIEYAENKCIKYAPTTCYLQPRMSKHNSPHTYL